jgi:hypothetical protein
LNRTHTSIRATAIVLLLLFLVGAVPKMYFHAALVHHKDITECSYPDKSTAHIDNDGFNCDIEQQVVTFPFIASFESLKLEPLPGVYTDFSEIPVPVLFSLSILTGTRGPPNA